MIKQIDRVTGDLLKQVAHFKRGGQTAVSVGIVGINHASYTVGTRVSGRREQPGKGGFLHPFQEAGDAERRLRADAAPAFDEFVILRYRATNEIPFMFEWVDYEVRLGRTMRQLYSHYSREYQGRF